MLFPNYIWKGSIKNYEDLKHIIMCYTESSNYGSSDPDVSKTDWSYEHDRHVPSKYLECIMDSIKPVILEMADRLGHNLSNLRIILNHNPWFHVYNKGSGFDWHTHDEQFGLVLYIQVDKDNGTAFYDPLKDTIFQPGVKNGDVIIFPSFLPHKSLKNTSDEDKIIVSMNFSLNSSVAELRLNNLVKKS